MSSHERHDQVDHLIAVGMPVEHRVEQRDDTLQVNPKARAPEPWGEGSGQAGVRHVSFPRAQYAIHPGRIGGVPDDRIPVRVDDDRAAGRPDDPKHLGNGGIDIGNVLEDLRQMAASKKALG